VKVLKRFEELGLTNTVMKAVKELGFEEMTPIQEQTIPLTMSANDVIGQAQTGTGKTAAFAIPMIEMVDTFSNKIQGLIMAPTRELAIQVADEIGKIGKYKKVKSLPVYGGQDITRQIRALKQHPHIIIATPGRLLDHMKRKNVHLDDIKMVVLDEADEMLDMGFLEDIETVLAACPEDKQMLLFSATMKAPIQKIANRFMKKPQMVAVKKQELTVPNVEQVYYEVHEREKLDVLCRLLDIQTPDLAILFGRTKRRVDELIMALQGRGYMCDGLHGDLSQAQRDRVMKKFRDGTIDVLIATDVAARGIDVSGVTHVFNFDIPQDSDSYVHRIGRTGRAGRTGVAITFANPREMGHLRMIEQATNKKIKRLPVPTLAEVREGKQQLVVQEIIRAMEDDSAQDYRSLAENLVQQHDTVSIVSAVLKLMMKEEQTKDQGFVLTEERPMREKKSRSYGKKDRKGYGDGAGRNRAAGGNGRGGQRPGKGRGGQGQDSGNLGFAARAAGGSKKGKSAPRGDRKGKERFQEA
jgi:ATP-dependent RNA helicase DeaD